MKRILITSTDAMMLEFISAHALYLCENGFYVEVACTNIENHITEIRELFNEKIKIHIVETTRNPLNITNLKGYKQLKAIIDAGNFDAIWTNEPVMGALTRIAAREARKNGTKVMYIAHGFHFYKGAPLKSWLLFYPIEIALSHLTDILLTITLEDYELARRKFRCCLVEHIYGIGARTDKYKKADRVLKMEMRKKENISNEAFLITCVGELNDNKNQIMLIKAIEKIRNRINIIALLAGPGENYNKLKKYISDNGLSTNIRLLGYRNNLFEVVPSADVAVSCSYREGLPINILEAMLSGIPVIASDNRGHRELVRTNETGFIIKPDDVYELADKLLYFANNSDMREFFGRNAVKYAEKYSFDYVKIELFRILNDLVN